MHFKFLDEFHPDLAESGGLKARSVKRTDLVESRNLFCTSREATSASLTRHQKSHLCIITLTSQLSSELFKKIPFCTHLLFCRYWPAIDNALRRAAFNYRVQVRLLVSCWAYTDPAMLHYLRSLRALNNPHVHISVDVVWIRNLVLERQLEDMAPTLVFETKLLFVFINISFQRSRMSVFAVTASQFCKNKAQYIIFEEAAISSY